VLLDDARDLHQQAVAATASGRPADGIALLRRALALLDWDPAARDADRGPDVDALIGRILLSLAWAELDVGHTPVGFDLLDAADHLVAPADRGVARQQRGLMLLRTGQLPAAAQCLDEAVPLLEAAEHGPVLARTLMNRANLRLTLGRVQAALDDFARCREVAAVHGMSLLSAKVWHNQAMAEMFLGDLPGALAALDTADALYRQHGPNVLPIAAAARARVLLAAGIASEAARTLDQAIGELAAQGLTQDTSEAQLMRAQASHAAGDFAAARSFAAEAADGFRKRGVRGWSALARLARLRAESVGTPADAGQLRRLRAIAAELRRLGLLDDARLATALVARQLVALGRPAQARQVLGDGRRQRPFRWLESGLMDRLARAELALAQGQPVAALAQARTGLAALDGQRGRLGSLDLRVGSAALGRELAALGLRTALAGGNPRTVLHWSERSRAQAFRVQPVRPPEDPGTAEALAQLRALRHQLRTAELAGAPRDAAVQARCAQLERQLRERDWQTAGAGVRSAPLAQLPDALGDRALVSYLSQDGELCAVLVTRAGTRLVRLGPTGALTEAVRRLLADLDALAGRTLPERLASVVGASLRRQCQELSERLVEPLVARVGDRELVIVPTDELAALPWAMLPALRGRPVSVAPSAAVWLTAQARPSTVDDAVLLAAGPDLAHVDREFDEIAAVHPGCRQLREGHAKVADTLAGLDGAALAHLAGHGHHEPENVLFSRLDLADGPLLAYDVQRLAAVPRLITLSACDIGRAEYRTGQEQLGFTSALLYAGAAGVVASVCRVSHETAANVMTSLHRALAGGAGAAAALAVASEKEPLATFVAFGAG
jgi:CHAT domain-containing protein/tetratricopeptide (TPR) repeat protein